MRYVITAQKRRHYSPTAPPDGMDMAMICNDLAELQDALKCSWIVVASVHEIGNDVTDQFIGPALANQAAKVVSPVIPA